MEPFWSKELPEFEVLPNTTTPIITKGGMWPHQKKWWDSKHFIRALVTGYGGGKTMIASKRAISIAIYNAPSPAAIISPSYKMAKRNVIPMVKHLLEGKCRNSNSLSFSYNKSEFEFTIRYMDYVGTIWVLSGNDPESLKGPNLGAAYIDEPFIMDREVFTQMLARVRDPMARQREIGLTGTPEELNWGYDICEGEDKDKYDIELVQASTRENKALPTDYASTLEKGFTDKASQAFVDGRFVSLSEGLVYYSFDPFGNVMDLPDPGADLAAGIDFNVDPMAFCVFWRKGKRMHIIKEYELPNADTEDACKVLRNDWGDRLKEVFPDASGKARSTNAPGGRSDFHIIREAGFEVRSKASNPARRDRFNAVNGKFKSRGENEAMLTISPECRKLKRYLMGYDHENAHKKKNMSHLLDAMGYPVAFLYPLITPLRVSQIVGF